MAHSTFTLSVEVAEGRTEMHPFHLGTDARVARQIAEERFRAGAKSVALMLKGCIAAIYDGEWSDYRPMREGW
jgi:hypothetical protein